MEELALKNLLIERPMDGVVRVVIDRQEQLNALDDATVAEIEQVFLMLAKDDKARVLIVTGAGQGARPRNPHPHDSLMMIRAVSCPDPGQGVAPGAAPAYL